MKMYKKILCMAALSMAITGSFSSVYADESKNIQGNKEILELTGFRGLTYRATSDQVLYNDYDSPVFSNARVEVIDSKTCLIVHVEDNRSGVKYVTIDNKTATRKNGSSYSGDYYVEIGTSGTHTIYAEDYAGNRRTESPSVTINDSTKPTLELSQTFKNGYCYLVIKASDNTALQSVTVNDTAITFSAGGGTENYRVTRSQKFTVIAKDIAGNTTRETFDVDINASQPSLTVDKTFKNNSWNLIIKAYPTGSSTISKVTVNNSKVSCSSAGQVIEYPVSSAGTYTVVVTDSFNQQATQSITVDANNSTSAKPTLTATAKDVGGIMCVAVTAHPSNLVSNNSLSSVTVNGVNIGLTGAGGSQDYIVSVSGTYTVVATDIYGNQTTQACSVIVPTPVTSTPSTPQNQNYGNSTGGSSNVVFKLNSKTWSKNGVSQTMDAPPINRNGRIYIPIRYVAYALNIESSNVTWDKNTKTAIIYDGDNTIKVPLGSKTMTVNGRDVAMDAAAISSNGRTYIPVSQIRSAFQGLQMSWNNTSKQITIKR